MVGRTREPSFVELFTPKLFTILRERYGLGDLNADVVAGLTVAIVALPLSMAIAIASGVGPDRGLYTAIVGGFVVSALGGSRFQIGGPAGAFIVLVAATVERHGVDGLILATLLSGLILLAIGFLRLGTFIKYIPYPVTVGFTSGIAIIIFASQLKELLGLTLKGKEPGPFIPKLQALGEALPSVNMAAVTVAALAIGVIVAVRRFRPHWPAFLIAVGLAAVADLASGPAGGDNRHPVRRHSPVPSGSASTHLVDGQGLCRAAVRVLIRAAGRNREPALGRGRRQHDRASAPFQRRVGGSGGG